MRLGYEEVLEEINYLCEVLTEPNRNWEDDVKEMNRVLKRDNRMPVLEVYSPPRIDAMARIWGLMPGMSFRWT